MPNIQDWLHQVDEAKHELDSYPPLSEGAIFRLRKEFKIIHTYDSNVIEGSQLSLRETALGTHCCRSPNVSRYGYFGLCHGN